MEILAGFLIFIATLSGILLVFVVGWMLVEYVVGIKLDRINKIRNSKRFRSRK